MARIVFQGEPRILADEMEGEQLLQELEIKPGHNLLAVRPEGNFVIAPRRNISLADDDEFIDAPYFEYGQ